MSRAETFDQLVEEAGRAHGRLLESTAALETLRGQPPAPGDLWVIPESAGRSGIATPDVEWGMLEEDEDGGLLVAPVDASPLVGSRDVVAPDGRVVRCGFAVSIDPAALAAGHRSGRLDAEILAAARERCRRLEEGRSESHLQALEVDRDPEYRSLVRGLESASRKLGQDPPAVSRAPLAAVAEHRPRDRRRLMLPAALAASLFLVLALVAVVLRQERTIAEMRSLGAEPIADAPVVWLEPVGERGLSEQETFLDGARFVVLVMRPESSGPTPDVYRLEIFTAAQGGEPAAQSGEPMWSGEVMPGEIPELFVLIPGHLLEPGEYRLELEARHGEEGIPAGRFALRVSRGDLEPP